MNLISLFNEVAVSVYLCVSLMLTDYLDLPSSDDGCPTREFLSWILTSILMVTILINFIYALYNLSIRLKAWFRRLRYKYQQAAK